MTLAALLLCIATVETQTLDGMNMTVVRQRFESCPVVEHVKFAPEMKYPKDCAKNLNKKGCENG